MTLKKNVIIQKNVEIGYSANQIISRLKTEEIVESLVAFQFGAESRLFIIGVIQKLQKIILTPWAINIIKKASCFNPKKLSQPKSLTKFRNLVLDLTSAKIITNDQGDASISEFRELLSKPEINSKLKFYNSCECFEFFFKIYRTI